MKIKISFLINFFGFFFINWVNCAAVEKKHYNVRYYQNGHTVLMSFLLSPNDKISLLFTEIASILNINPKSLNLLDFNSRIESKKVFAVEYPSKNADLSIGQLVPFSYIENGKKIEHFCVIIRKG